MRVEDAPPAGWYPDPEGGSRLRWWEGTDWADRWRAPPTPGVVEIRRAFEAQQELDHGAPVGFEAPGQTGGLSRADSQAIISQVRQAARDEAERAAQLFRQEIQGATRSITPLITQYTSKFTRWFRTAAVLTVIVLVAWLAFQIFAQASLFEWIGDRIDNISNNLTDDESGLGLGAMFW